MAEPSIELEQSHANHGVLIELREGIHAIAFRFDKFATQQGEENAKIHLRIDQTQEKFLAVTGGLKDNMAERGRITFPMVSFALAVLLFIGGVGGAYVSMRTDPLKSDIVETSLKLSQAETHRLAMEQVLQKLAVASAVKDGKSETDRDWIKKLLDEERKKL